MATTSLPKHQQMDFNDLAIVAEDLVATGALYVAGSTFAAADLDLVNDLTATAAEVNRATDLSARIVNVTAATLAVALATHEGKTVTLNKADGLAVTLPAAAATGARYRFVIGTTTTSVGYTFVVTGDDTYKGVAVTGDSTNGTAHVWVAVAGDNRITLGGTDNATGGLAGDIIELEDIAADVWSVRITGGQGGTEATPFSTV